VYNRGGSVSSETVFTVMRITPFGVDFVICNFLHFVL